MYKWAFKLILFHLRQTLLCAGPPNTNVCYLSKQEHYKKTIDQLPSYFD